MRRRRFLILPLAALLLAWVLVLVGDLGKAQVTGGGPPGMPYNQGPVTPGTCGAPMMFYNNTSPGTYLGCIANGTFSSLGSGGGGGATMLAQMGDLAVTKTTGTQLTVCANCSTATPATVGFRWYSQQITGPITVNLSGTLTDFAYIYYINGTGVVVGSPTLVMTCTGACSPAGGPISAFPTNSVPIAQVHALSGVWDAITPLMDSRSFLRTANVAGTAGVSCGDSNGDLQCSADQAAVMYRTTVPGTLTSPCTPNNFAMDTTNLYVCQASGNWLKFTSGVGTGTGTPGPTVWVAKGVNYTMTAADFSAYTGFYVNSGTPTLTLAPNTPQPPAGQCVAIMNIVPGAGVTIARNGQSLNTSAAGSMTLAGGGPYTPSSTTICSDGTNYYTENYFFGFRGATGTILTTSGSGALASSGVSVNNVPIYGDANIGVRNGEALGSGTGVAGNLACATAANTQGSCTAAGAANFLGVFSSTTNYVTEGQVTVNLDASSTVAFGDFICSSGTVAGAMHANSTTPCTAGTQIGIAVASGSGVTTILTSLRR